ncbi:glycoside hydrolase family 2 protein [Coniophora puteana RWD-64-598 SS2]|uniref:Beta-mannosidase A n=1 Tax=Coniophora puteana (strain RWD-64-598) TaxID=741705 RepID=A0A5M3MCT2_CONPW|nr:glycoside hydrolase family 2 protein [Coniophora puteana RWD-64-598 SS2]EIW76704.1 glycoside hydrolase family 2 protein [Coniophora puteana RWD-64-598 SS2]
MLSRTLLALAGPSLALGQVVDLSQLSWTLKNANGSIAIPGSLPSQAHLDLAKAGIITEPLLGINEFTERWVWADNWTYTADMSSAVSSGSNDTSLLVFYGIDTVADITLAGHPVGWVDNQFVRWVFDVSGYLQSPVGDDKNLTIAIESAWYYGLNASTLPGSEQLIGDDEASHIRTWTRKIQDDWGWDWGPAFIPSGIHKPAYFVTLSGSNASSASNDSTVALELASSGPVASSSSIFLDETSVDIYKSGTNVTAPPPEDADWVVNVTFGIRSSAAFDKPTVTLAIPELQLTSEPLALDAIAAQTTDATYMSINWTIPDSTPQRWYPAGLGTPQLYNLTITLSPSGSGSSDTIEQTIRTGFRTIYLDQRPYTSDEVAARGITPGDRWHFLINGQQFYAKGTNLIPLDPFYPRLATDKARWLLESALASGQNMLRIWGGGAYQPSSAGADGGVYDFYALCDELGVLAWSELIFSDTPYPVADWYLAGIEQEVRQNVRRVNKHPSNVQWAGGNEIEGIVMLLDGGGGQLMDEFLQLFQDFLHDIVYSETKSVVYTDCSTTHGALSLDPYVLRLGNATAGSIYGNSERYDYTAENAFNLSSFQVSRFVNEFGFHSMPSFYSWEEVLQSPDDFSFNSSVVMSRDHHPFPTNMSWPNPNAPEGQAEMTEAVQMWLPTPGTTNSNQTFAQWCWSTQVFQAMTIGAQIAWHRRGAGLGENNLGSLVWQLNDIWQGVSWAAVEYSGRWKVLNYQMASVYSPVVISPFWFPANESLTVLATSDRWDDVQGTAQLTWYDWSGKVLNSSQTKFDIPSLNNSVIFEGTNLSTILPQGANASDAWLLMNLTSTADGKAVTNEQYFTPVSLAEAALVDPQIAVTPGDDFTFTLSAKGGVAPWTWVDHPTGTVGYFVDTTTGTASNGFYLVPGIDRTVRFKLEQSVSTNTNPDPADFVVRSLWNNTHV